MIIPIAMLPKLTKAGRTIGSILTLFSLFISVQSQCQPEDCIPGEWTNWSPCSASCNDTPGVRQRERSIIAKETCGGSCTISKMEEEPCNREVCCPHDCEYTQWSDWRFCYCTNQTSVCDLNGEERWVCTRSRSKIREASCGGYCNKPGSTSESVEACGILCCQKNCIASEQWSFWGSCNGQCEQRGTQSRHQYILQWPKCGGTPCELVQKNETRACDVGCCPVHCVLGEWGEWSNCNATCGAGLLRRTRFVQNAECGGEECSESPDEIQYKDCTKYINVDCVVSPWSLWSGCVLDYGECGSGQKNRSRNITIPAECYGKPCPDLYNTTMCYGPCCKQDCVVSEWKEWGPCSSECGAGISERKRTVDIPQACGGSDCPGLLETKECNVTTLIDCKMSDWGEWSACSNNCGEGKAFRSRSLLTPAYCGGQQCANITLEDVMTCQSFAGSVDCVVTDWQPWTACIRNCEYGVQQRYRQIVENQVCNGKPCPTLIMNEWQEWEDCHRDCDHGIQIRRRTVKINAQCQGAKCPSSIGFQHCHEKCKGLCNQGVCSCPEGEILASDGVSCKPIQCPPIPSLSYCPPERPNLGSCSYPLFSSCFQHTYNTTCTASCQQDRELMPPQEKYEVICQKDAKWSQPKIFCSPRNNPPKDITIEQAKTKILENTPAGDCLYMNTIDDDYDKHVYTIVMDAPNRFYIVEHRLCLLRVADYEEPPTKWNVTIRSTDLAGAFIERTFGFEITNANDPPKAVYLKPNNLPENSMNNTKVGCLSGVDDDPSQTLSFVLVNSYHKIFATYEENGETCVKVVRESDPRCLTEGGSFCLLNYEELKRPTITIMAIDDGSPRQKAYFDVYIKLTDVNDKPTAVKLESPVIPEGVEAGGDLVALTTEDEDVDQTYTYDLINDPSGLFSIRNGILVASRSFDYESEESTEFDITVKSTDDGRNGQPLSVISNMTFMIEDINEPPFDLEVTSINAMLTFDINKPKVKENGNALIIGTIVIKDHDKDDTVTLTLLGNADNRLSLKNPQCLKLQEVNVYCRAVLIAYASFNHEIEPTIPLSIKAADAAGLSQVINVTLEVLNVNDAATDILINGKNATEVSVEENKLNALIGNLSSVDEDAQDQHVYSIIDPSGLFVLQGNQLKTSASVKLDYEKATSYQVTLTTTDNGVPPMSHDKEMIIQLVNVNEAPTDIQLSRYQIAENSAPGTPVGDLSASDPDNTANAEQTFTYELIDNAAGRFQIQGSQLQVKDSKELCNNKPCILDFEDEKTLTIKVKVTDDGSPTLTFEKTLTLTITDVNDPPKVDIAGNTIPENSQSNFEIGLVTVKDQDQGQTVTIQLLDNTDFFILKEDNTLVAKQSLDFEKQAIYNITIQATDNGTPVASSNTVITVKVLNINEGPEFNGETTLAIAELSPIGATVGTVTVIDPDLEESLTLEIQGVSQVFHLTNIACSNMSSPGTKCTADLSTLKVLEYGDKSVYTISMVTQDRQGLTVSQVFTVNVLDINNAPKDILFNGAEGTSLRIRENVADVDITELTALDPDEGQTHSYMVQEENSVFEILGSLLRVKADAVIDYETLRSYSVFITATDSGTPPKKFTKNVTLTVDNINEETTDLSLDTNKVPENSDMDTVIGRLLVTDPDNAVEQTQTFRFVLVNSADGRFKIQGDQLMVALSNSGCLSEVRGACKLDYEDTSQFTVDIDVTDSGLVPVKSKQFSLVVEVTNQNDAPKNIQLSGNKIEENAPTGTEIGQVTFDDEDEGQNHIISLVNDNSGRFSVTVSGFIVKATGERLDPSTVYDIVVRVEDDGGPQHQADKMFSITVIGETFISLTFTSNGGTTTFDDGKPRIPENSDIGSVVGSLRGVHSDLLDMTFDIKDSNGLGILRLSDSSCETVDNKRICTAKVLVDSALDYETVNQYTLLSEVTNSAGKKTIESFLLTITDVNEAPLDVTFAGGHLEVEENLKGVTVGVFSVEDPDKTDTHTFALTDNGGGKFVMSSNGQLSVSSDADLDYEAQSSVNIEISATDSGDLSITRAFTVLIVDVNEPPTDLKLTENTVAEMSVEGTVVGDLIVADPDQNQTFTFTLVNDAEQRFTLGGKTLKVKSVGEGCDTIGNQRCLLDFESANSHNIVVMVTDSGAPSMTKEFTLNVAVSDVNDGPYNLALKMENLPEDLPTGSKVATITVEDQDSDDVYTYVITRGVEGPFTVIDNTVTLTEALDYELMPSYTITVEARDSRNEPKKISADFVLQVTNVNEAPFDLTLKAISGKTSSFQDNKPVIDENKPTNTLIGQLVAFDPDSSDTLTFTTTSTKVKLFNQYCIPVGQGIRCTSDIRSAGVFDFETESLVYLLFYVADQEGVKINSQVVLSIRNSNDPPTDIMFDGTLSVAENSVDLILGTLSAVDVDANQINTYTIQSDSKFFYIAHDKLKVTSAAELDYEKQTTHDVTIRATDNGEPAPLYFEKVFTVTVTNVNEAPSDVRLTKNKIPENTKSGTLVGTLIVDDPDNTEDQTQTFTYSLKDSADGRFKILGNGQLVVDVADFDFEREPSFTIDVTVQDSGLPPLSKDGRFTIDLIDVNDPPTDLQLSSESVEENAVLGTVVGTLTAVDHDAGQMLSYSMSKGDYLSVAGNSLVVSGAIDYESSQEITFEVTVTDDGIPPMSTAKNFTVQVTNKNEKPAEIRFNPLEKIIQGKIPESTKIDDVIGTVVAYDPDYLDKITFTFGENSGDAFKLSSALPNCVKSTLPQYMTECSIDIQLKKVLNFEDETQRTQMMVIKATDHYGLQLQKELVFSVLNSNEPPYDIILNGEITSIPENSPNFLLGKLDSLDDDESDEHVYQLITFWELFFVKDGMLIARSPLDFEKKESYAVTIKSKDNGEPPMSFTKTFVFNVTDENEAPTNITISSNEVSNDAAVGDPVGIVTVTDPDNSGTVERQTHSCTVGGEGVGIFTVNSIDMLLKVSAPVPLETTMINVTITCADSGDPSLSTSVSMVIHVRETIEIPKILILTDQRSVPENTDDFTVGKLQVVHQLTKEALEESFLYLISSMETPFILDGDLLKIGQPLDYEVQNQWEVTVTASGFDNGNMDIGETFTVAVSDVNESPIKIGVYGGGYLPENSAPGTIIGDLNTEDHEKDQTYKYELLGIANGIDQTAADPALDGTFILDGKTLKVGNQSDLINYEISEVFTVLVKSTDSGEPPLSLEDGFHVVITDVNDPPTDVMVDKTDIAENSPVGTEVGKITVIDEDKDQVHACEIQNSADVPFHVQDQVKIVVSRAELDYEKTKTYVLMILCKDHGEDGSQLVITKAVTFNVTNVNEAPSDITMANLEVPESILPGEIVGKVSATDPDSTQVNFLLEKTDVFKVEGEDTIVTMVPLDYEETEVYSLSIRATDSEGLFTVRDFTLKVLDVNESPTGIQLDNTVVEENLAEGSLVGIFTTEDPDRRQTFTYRLVSEDSEGYFAISGNKLVTSGVMLDYETNTEYKVMVESTDSGLPSKSLQEEFTIIVKDANDPPTAILFDSVPPLKEDTPVHALVTKIQVDDPDNDQSHSCHLQTKGTPFTVLTNENEEMRLVLSSKLNYESINHYDLVIQCSDGEFDIEKKISITVEDVNEPPSSISLSGSNTILADAKPDDLIGQLSTIDPDSNQAHNFVLKGQNSDVFKIEGNKLLMNSSIPTDILTSAKPEIRITIQVSDNGDPIMYLVQNFTLLITNVKIVAAELPPVALDNTEVDEDAEIGTVIGNLYNVNQSLDEDIEFQLEKNPNNLFSIKNNQQLVLEKSLADYVGTSVTVLVKVSNVETFESLSQPVIILIKSVDRCLRNGKTCSENARCVKLNETHHNCHCEDGYTRSGYTCTNIDDCVGGTICQNGGTCVDGINSHSCLCTKEFNGQNCEISLEPQNPCRTNPCKNSGVCQSEDGKSYVCDCQAGWTGATCEESVNDCEKAQCEGGGVCIDKHRTYICECPDTRTGPRCQYYISSCEGSSCSNGTIDMCIPLYNKQDYTCAASENDLVELTLKYSGNGVNENEVKARVGDLILELLDRTGVSTTNKRRKRRSTEDGDVEVYVVDVNEKDDNYVLVSFAVLNYEDKPYTKEEVVQMLSQSCSDIEKEGLEETDVCPAIQKQQLSTTAVPTEKPEEGGSGAVIGGAVGGIVVVIIIIIIVVIVIKRRNQKSGN